MRLALKFGYDGTKFGGYQRQKEGGAVENAIIDALMDMEIIQEAKESRFQSASRTDRGVSALGNVVALDTDFKPGSAISALNSSLENVWFWGYREVSEDFKPRQADVRWYRYHLKPDLDIDVLKRGAKLFLGDHDFARFCRRIEGESTLRTIDHIELTMGQDFMLLDIKARSFLWNMVRRIVSALLQLEKGKCTQKEIADALKGRSHDFGVAPPEPLFLIDVSYGFEFERDGNAVRKLNDRLVEKLFRTRLQESLLAGINQRNISK